MERRLAMLVLVASVALVGGPARSAGASCAPTPAVPQALAESDLVFIGTAVSLANDDRWATFVIERTWKGDPGAERVEVRAGPPGSGGGGGNGAATSVDRTYQLGTRYLVFARAVSSGDRSYGARALWSDNACSATQPYTAGLDQFRPERAAPLDERTPPATIRAPLPPIRTPRGGGQGEASWAWVPGIVTLAIVLGVIFIPHRGRAKEPVRP
ncbi:MAG: hypothetical protein ABR540_01570 [Acidimicrobiales bacterium]